MRKPDFARKKVDLNRAIRIVHGIVAQQLKLQNIIVNLELEENIPFILAHSTRLEQVTFNLVTNAQDAILQKTKDGLESETRESTITIRTFAENDHVAQGAEFGFIKFGSRVDVFIPLDADIRVKVGQKAKAGVTVLAELE